MTGTIKECDYLVSILNSIIEKEGYNVDVYGFGYYDDGRIETANGDDLSDALAWVWNDFCTTK